MKPGWPIRRNYLPADLAPELRACGLDGCVAVQARQSLEESRWLLELADASPIVKGVVGWVDLRGGGRRTNWLLLAATPKFVGVRPAWRRTSRMMNSCCGRILNAASRGCASMI